MRNVFTMLALLGTTIAPSLATESNGVGARGRATPVGSQRLETMSAVEFRQFVRSGNQWEDRTKTWQNHETAMTPMSTSRITKLWAVAEVGSIRLRTSDLRDRQPRIVLMFGNDGLFAMHGMAPGDTMYAVLQMEERSDAIEAFGVVVAQSGRIFVHSLGRPQVCYRWRPAATELSYPSFISGRSCDPSVEDPHNAATLEKPPHRKRSTSAPQSRARARQITMLLLRSSFRRFARVQVRRARLPGPRTSVCQATTGIARVGSLAPKGRAASRSQMAMRHRAN